MQGLSFFKVSVRGERGSFILEIAGDPFHFFFWVFVMGFVIACLNQPGLN